MYNLWHFQARKVEDLGSVDFDEEIKKRFKQVYVPNWFTVDLKTGASTNSMCMVCVEESKLFLSTNNVCTSLKMSVL